MAKIDKVVKQIVSEVMVVVEDVILDSLINVGEQFVADARSVNTYQDQTSNLRGSIGYVILREGEELFGNFTGVSEAGKAESLRLISTIKGKYSSGYTLILVAGMSYAVYVEAKHGLDVITGSAQIAETNFKNEMRKIITKLKQL